jgi:hypothetical protein
MEEMDMPAFRRWVISQALLSSSEAGAVTRITYVNNKEIIDIDYDSDLVSCNIVWKKREHTTAEVKAYSIRYNTEVHEHPETVTKFLQPSERYLTKVIEKVGEAVRSWAYR